MLGDAAVSWRNFFFTIWYYVVSDRAAGLAGTSTHFDWCRKVWTYLELDAKCKSDFESAFAFLAHHMVAPI